MSFPLFALIFTPLVGLLGVFLGGWIARQTEKDKRRADFLRKQLSEFYGPMHSLREEIRVHSELRVKIQNAASRTWTNLSSKAKTPEAKGKLSRDRSPQFQAIIKDDNNKFVKKLIPDYQKMINIFRDKMWLAEPETRKYYYDLVEFLDIWDRNLRGALPIEVIGELDHDEGNLKPFYEHIEATLNSLRNELK